MGDLTRILVAIDFSDAAYAAAEHAVQRASPDDVVDLLHVRHPVLVVHPAGPLLPTMMAAPTPTDEMLAEDLEMLAARLSIPADAPDINVHVERGIPQDVLVEASKHYDLIVMGSKDRGRISRFLLGSVGDAVSHSAHCPVLFA